MRTRRSPRLARAGLIAVRKRAAQRLLGFFVLSILVWVAATRTPRGFAPFVPQALPQRASGDFDGDGREDLALIQQGANGSHISISLSESSGTVSLPTGADVLIATDFDHDGDIDLVAVAPSGQLTAWLNDGRGRFTAQEPVPVSAISPEAVVSGSSQTEPMALASTVPLVVPGATNGTTIVVTLAHAPTVPPAFALVFLSFLGLRSPPVSLRLT